MYSKKTVEMVSDNIVKRILTAALAFSVLTGAAAQGIMQRGEPMLVSSRKSSLEKSRDRMTAKIDLDLTGVKIKSNQAAVFTPMIVNGEDTLRLPGIGIYGHIRWYQYERFGLKPIGGPEEISMRVNDRKGMVNYSRTVAYDSWMNGASLILRRTDYGCAGCADRIDYAPEILAEYREVIYEPELIFQAAVAEEVKTRELSGRAYVDFPVNLTTIYPDYRNNAAELAKITATIDSVRNDKDITVKALSIKGFASPEGSYENNVRLAKGRTEALRNHIQQLYSFPYGFIETSYEPEDWEGLREYVVGSSLPNRDGILAIIDSYLAPDPKNAKIQSDYPEQYAFLLQTVYPGLRHSDYRIEYTIRGFSDVAEIAEIMRTQPSKLSLNEMYLLAATLVPGSQDYNDVMETAVKMFPSDEVAILNAAVAAMQRDDLTQAERYLARAGVGAEALYARGVLEGLRKDYAKAIRYMEQAAAKGHASAAGEMEKLNLAKQYAE